MEITSNTLLEQLGRTPEEIQRLSNKTLRLSVIDTEDLSKTASLDYNLKDFIAIRDFYEIDLHNQLLEQLLKHLENVNK